MIDANNTWVLWSIIVGIATISIFLENRYKWAAKISGAIIGLLLAATLSNLGIIPVDSPVYDQVWGVVVPLAIPMLLFQCDLKQIWKESGRLVVIFLISSLGTVLGAFLGYLFLSKSIPVLNHIAGMMVGSYIGGGVNFVAVSSAFEIPKELISAATVADNLLMVFYFLILLMIPSIGFFKKHFKFAYTEGVKEEEEKAYGKDTVITVQDVAFVFAISVIIVTISFTLSEIISGLGDNSLIQLVSNKYLILTTLTVACSTIFAKYFKKISGPTTAAAMAISKGWHRFVAPTMLVGTLGYIIGTYVGIFIGQILN